MLLEVVLKRKIQDQEKVPDFLTYGLTNFDLVEISKSDKPFNSVDVWLGKENTVKVYTKENIYKTIKKDKEKT